MLACILDRGNHKAYNHSTVDSIVDSTVDMPEIAADWESQYYLCWQYCLLKALQVTLWHSEG